MRQLALLAATLVVSCSNDPVYIAVADVHIVADTADDVPDAATDATGPDLGGDADDDPDVVDLDGFDAPTDTVNGDSGSGDSSSPPDTDAADTDSSDAPDAPDAPGDADATDTGDDVSDGGSDVTESACHSLRFAPGQRVTVPNAAELQLLDTAFTVEYWLELEPLGVEPVEVIGLHTECVRGAATCGGWATRVAQAPQLWPEFWDFVRATTTAVSDKSRGVGPIPESRWTHVAYTYSWPAKEMWFWIDGEATPERERPLRAGLRADAADLVIGDSDRYFTDDPAFGGLSGRVGAVRISSTQRYTESFVPDRRWTPDDDTVALWTFAEGSGDHLADASDNGHDGVIEGPTWTEGGPACPD